MRTKLMVFGGIGGITPVLVNLATLDANTMFATFNQLVFLGWLVKTLILFSMGAFVVYLNNESNQVKAIQISVMRRRC